MTTRRPLVIISGEVQELPVGDSVAGGSGGSGGPWYFNPPLAASFPTNLTAGAATLTSFTDDSDIGLVLAAKPSANVNCFAQLMAQSTYPFTITAHIAAAQGTATLAGIVLYDQTNGVRVCFGADSAGALDVSQIKSTGTASQVDANTIVGPRGTVAQTGGLWLRIVATAQNNVVFYTSADGKNWILHTVQNGNGNVTALSHIGLIIEGRGGVPSGQAFLTCDYWNVS